jgi:hypothetical protein
VLLPRELFPPFYPVCSIFSSPAQPYIIHAGGRERERKRKETKIFNDAEKIHPSITKHERKKRG